jgi:hypothetical protein
MLTTTWANLVVVDTFLVIQQRQAPFIKIYSTNNHKLLAEFGTQGSGPNEFEMPDLLKEISYEKQNNSPIVTLYDIGSNRISQVNIFRVIENTDDAITQERAPDLNSVTVILYHNDDSLFLANPETGGRFVIHNEATNETKYVPFVPELDEEMKEHTKSSIFQSFVIVNKKRNKFVAAPTFLNELNFFDLQGNYINSTIISPREKLLPPPGIQALPTGIVRHSSSLVEIENKIYVLKRGPDEGKIQVFDWDGMPIEQYILEANSRIGSFAYDKIHKQFYLCFPDEEPYNIYTYPLK